MSFNNVWNATLLERGLFHYCILARIQLYVLIKFRNEALVECDEREEVIHNIHIDRTKYPPSAASAPASLTI